MSRCTRPASWASASELQAWNQKIDHARSGLWAKAIDQRFEVHAVQQFHDVEARAIGRDAIVEEFDRVA